MDDGRYGRSMDEWGTRVRKEAKDYRIQAIGEAQLTDLAGQLRSIEKGLATQRLEISSEFGDSSPGTNVTTGRKWTAKTPKVGQRSYNAASIFTSTQANGLTMIDLVNSGALKLTWGWQKLVKFFATNEIELRTIGHELNPDDHTDDDDGEGDGEGPHVGVWYKAASTSYDRADEG